jgi:nucleoside transporter
MTQPMAPPMSSALQAKLSLMMFLQYAIWGAWLPLLYPFLSGHRGFTAGQISDMFAVGAAGAIVAPFVAGQIADRYFDTEKYLALSHIAGGLLVWQLGRIEGYRDFLVFSLAYSLLYSPTMPLTNSLAFHHMPDRDRDFGRVRVWGTVGWIAAGIGIGQWLLRRHTPADGALEEVLAAQQAGMADAFRLSGLLGVTMGFFCWFLPHTPPQRGERRSATAEALAAVRRQPLATLFLLAVPISCIHQFYFVHTSLFLGLVQARTGAGAAAELGETISRVFGVGGGGLMTLGQMSEVACIAAMPFLTRRYSRKALLLAGTAAYAARMALFAYAGEISGALGISEILVAIAGVVLHGPVFAFWIFLAFLIVDEETTGDVRASAQSLFNLIIVGVGIIVGSKLAGLAAERATLASGELDYTRLFFYPLWAALACLAVLWALYPSRRPAAG